MAHQKNEKKGAGILPFLNYIIKKLLLIISIKFVIFDSGFAYEFFHSLSHERNAAENALLNLIVGKPL